MNILGSKMGKHLKTDVFLNVTSNFSFESNLVEHV